jgi:hypothetical protein
MIMEIVPTSSSPANTPAPSTAAKIRQVFKVRLLGNIDLYPKFFALDRKDQPLYFLCVAFVLVDGW